MTALNSAKASKLKDDYYKLQENEEIKKLNELLGIEWEKGIVKYESPSIITTAFFIFILSLCCIY